MVLVRPTKAHNRNLRIFNHARSKHNYFPKLLVLNLPGTIPIPPGFGLEYCKISAYACRKVHTDNFWAQCSLPMQFLNILYTELTKKYTVNEIRG